MEKYTFGNFLVYYFWYNSAYYLSLKKPNSLVAVYIYYLILVSKFLKKTVYIQEQISL